MPSFMALLLMFSSCCLVLSAASGYNIDSGFSKDCSTSKKVFVVIKVFDGDTILVNAGGASNHSFKIRFLGIDAFESNQNIYGKQAKDFLTKLALNKTVCIETDIEEKDRYGRTLGYVFLKSVSKDLNKEKNLRKKDLSINEVLVKNGQALLYAFPPNIKYVDRLKESQIYARQNMLGVWEKESYIKETPAQWRHKHPHKKYKK